MHINLGNFSHYLKQYAFKVSQKDSKKSSYPQSMREGSTFNLLII